MLPGDGEAPPGVAPLVPVGPLEEAPPVPLGVEPVVSLPEVAPLGGGVEPLVPDGGVAPPWVPGVVELEALLDGALVPPAAEVSPVVPPGAPVPLAEPEALGLVEGGGVVLAVPLGLAGGLEEVLPALPVGGASSF